MKNNSVKHSEKKEEYSLNFDEYKSDFNDCLFDLFQIKCKKLKLFLQQRISFKLETFYNCCEFGYLLRTP